MYEMRKHKLVEMDWPEFGLSERPRGASSEEFEGRIAATRTAMVERGLTHLVVYADREHFANLAFLTGFDPRFEEAMLILGLCSDRSSSSRRRLLRTCGRSSVARGT